MKPGLSCHPWAYLPFLSSSPKYLCLSSNPNSPSFTFESRYLCILLIFKDKCSSFPADEGKLLFTECQLKDREAKTELENIHFVPPIDNLDSKIIKWRLLGNSIFSRCQNSTSQISCSLQRETYTFTWETTGYHYLNHEIKFLADIGKATLYVPDVMWCDMKYSATHEVVFLNTILINPLEASSSLQRIRGTENKHHHQETIRQI